MKKVKVLHYYTQYNLGGTERVIYSILTGINKKKFDCYFLSVKSSEDEAILESNGINILKIEFNKKFKENLYKLFLNNHFDIIHVHNCSEMNIVLQIAKKAGIKKRIAHSHVSHIGSNKMVLLLKSIKSIKTEYYANRYYACSIDAAKWLFPRKYKKALVILNSVDKDKFKYDECERKQIRKELNISDNDFVLIMVSRLSTEKNHFFALEVLNNLLKINKNYKLLIIGSGPLENDIRNKIVQLNLLNKVTILGSKKNVRPYLSASDLFLMPSKFEGLGISSIEAQFNGLHVVCSNRIPHEVDVEEELIRFIDLNIKKWTNEIENIQQKQYHHIKSIKTDEFSNKIIIKKIESDYLK